jgi:hypothetical protein
MSGRLQIRLHRSGLSRRLSSREQCRQAHQLYSGQTRTFPHQDKPALRILGLASRMIQNLTLALLAPLARGEHRHNARRGCPRHP